MVKRWWQDGRVSCENADRAGVQAGGDIKRKRNGKGKKMFPESGNRDGGKSGHD